MVKNDLLGFFAVKTRCKFRKIAVSDYFVTEFVSRFLVVLTLSLCNYETLL